ncbi:MAG: hypothetical protein JWQ27_3234 [Ferruginibacter sp.]|nr:hypothetical protein [Ferruginibacter sp.]
MHFFYSFSKRILLLVFISFFATTSFAQVPANDDPCNAITLPVSSTCSYQIFTNVNATGSVGVPAPGCASYSGGDVWFQITVPCTGSVVIDTQTGSMFDGGMAVYTGSCGALNLLSCDDDSSPNGSMPMITRTGLVPGSTLWIRVWEFGNNANGSFGICVRIPPPPAPNTVCNNAFPFCTSNIYTFPNNTNVPSLGGSGIYGCLLTVPNPVWYYMQVQTAGNIVIGISQTSNAGVGIDVDYALWGPFSNLPTSCSSLSAANNISCSYSANATETATITNAQVGEYYIMVLTNYSNQPGTITFSQTGGTGATSCAIVCNLTVGNTGPVCPGGTFNLTANNIPNAVYSWTGPNCFISNQQNPTGIVAPTVPGSYTYSLLVTTAGGSSCYATTTVVVGGLAGTETHTSPNCPGVNDGTITINPNPPGNYTYVLTPGNVTQINNPVFTGLAAGTYSVTFSSALGCSGTVSNIVLAPPTPLTGTATTTPTSCPTRNDGTITVTPSGAGPYTFTLNPGNISQTSPTFTGLAPGTYSISFVTASNCTGAVTTNPTVTAGPFLTSTVTTFDPPCSNINNGTITINPNGTGPYSFTLNPGAITQTNATFTNLAPGSYTYNYTDANGCTGTGTASLTTNPPLTINVALTMPLCNGNSNGVVSLTGGGGVPGYDYAISPFSTYQASGNGVFTGLAAGTYTFRVRDTKGCTKDTTVTLAEPPALNATAANTTKASCSNNDGIITASPSGGTSPYTFAIAGPTVNTSGATSGIFTGLSLGNYTVTVTDAKGCTKPATAAVDTIDNMTLTLGADQTICVGSSITLQPQTNPLTSVYKWRSTNAPITTLSSDIVKNPVATPTDTAQYILNAKWGVCTREDSMIINVLHKPVAHAGKDTAICFSTYAILRGSATNTSGAVLYSWAPVADFDKADTAVAVARPDSAGLHVYTLTVRDNYGCNFSVTDDVNVTVQPPVPAYAGHDTIAIKSVPHQLFGSGGTSYVWSPASPLNNPFAPNPLATLTNDTKFTLVVTDIAGCIGYDTVFVKVYEGPTYYIPNTFTPNGDGLNDIFRAIPVGINKTDWFRIFNRYGELVFETNQWLKGWDGTYKGKAQPMGVYIWIIKGVDKNNKTIEMKGTIMLAH